MRGGAGVWCFVETAMEFMRKAHMFDGEIELRNANVE